MKYFVMCDLNEIESTDLSVEAPSARIAEAKVRSCFPGWNICNPPKLIEDESTFTVLRPYLRPFIYTNIGIFAYMFFIWGDSWRQALLYTPLISLAIFLIAPLCNLFIEIAAGNLRKRETMEELEREYSRREGYLEGWRDCESKAEPKFNEWARADRWDIHPYRGPLIIPE